MWRRLFIQNGLKIKGFLFGIAVEYHIAKEFRKETN